MKLTTTHKNGLGATPEALAKLELIAQHQSVSPKAQDITEPSITETEKLPLSVFLSRAQDYFSKGLTEVSEGEEDDYLEWAAELIIYCGKRLCSATQAELGDIFGYSKGQAKAVAERIERKIMKDGKKGNYDLLLFLNDFRHHLYGISIPEGEPDFFSWL